MPSVTAGDWEYEELDEAEPYEGADEAEPYEASDEAADEAEDAEYEPEYDGEAVYRRQPPRRTLPPQPALRGVQTAVVRTPAGNASIKLPSRVPTLKELSRVQRDLAMTRRQLRTLSVRQKRSRRTSKRIAHEGGHGARNGIFIVALESVRDVLRDVGTFSLIHGGN